MQHRARSEADPLFACFSFIEQLLKHQSKKQKTKIEKNQQNGRNKEHQRTPAN